MTDNTQHAAAAAAAAAAPEDLNNSFNMNAKGINKLLAAAQLEQSSHANSNQRNRNLASDYYTSSRISKYSIQFQGCHQIHQWNKDAQDDNDVRVATKRLVRFRLVPYEKCSTYNPWMDASGLSGLFGQADYGDYVVDMSTFVAAYLETKEESESHYYGDRKQRKLGDNAFDLADYTSCAGFGDYTADDDQSAYDYYLGPYCANQGGEIRLNMFTDDACTTVAKCNGGATRGAKCYTKQTGMTIPYSDESIIDDPCVSCSENFNYLDTLTTDTDAEGGFDYSTYDFGYARDSCSTLYEAAGKCENSMKDGQYNYGCTYIQGITIGVSQDGYAVAVKRSLGADAAMATLAISVSFVGMYIYYLRYVLRQVDSKQYKSDFYVPSRLG